MLTLIKSRTLAYKVELEHIFDLHFLQKFKSLSPLNTLLAKFSVFYENQITCSALHYFDTITEI